MKLECDFVAIGSALIILRELHDVVEAYAPDGLNQDYGWSFESRFRILRVIRSTVSSPP